MKRRDVHSCSVAVREAAVRRRQSGSSLLFALIALVLLALAAVGLTRSVNTGALIIGNLAFKQEVALAGDRAAETAIAWIEANSSGTVLLGDAEASGYYSTSLDALDPTGRLTSVASRAVVDWDMDGCEAAGGSFSSCITPSAEVVVNGNRSRYVITRLCAASGDPNDSSNSCMSPLIVSGPDDLNRAGYDYAKPTSLGDTTTAPLYRIVVRTVGARGTTGFTEAIVHM
jgi:Tfp pilus assembly protein PilX